MVGGIRGAKIVAYTNWRARRCSTLSPRANTKQYPEFGTKFNTRILLQDHGDEIWFRNVKVRPLKASAHITE
jgi:hypothetical protein